MRSDDDLKRDKMIARATSGFFISALAIASYAADQLVIRSGYSKSIWAAFGFLATGLVSYVVVGWVVEHYWRNRRKR